MTEKPPPPPATGPTGPTGPSGQTTPKEPAGFNVFKEARKFINELPPRYQTAAKLYLYSRGFGFAARLFVQAAMLGFVGYGYVQLRGRQQEFLTVKEGTVLRWKPHKQTVSEAPPEAEDVFGQLQASVLGHMTLLDAVRALEWAKDDDRVRGLVADFSVGHVSRKMALGLAQSQELRAALQEFRDAKRARFGDAFQFVAVTDTFDSQLGYFLASAFDRVVVEPVGTVPLTGINSVSLFVRNLLDKIGVRVHVEAREAHKSVVSVFSETKWPKAQYDNMVSLLTDVNDQLVDAIAAARARVLPQRAAASVRAAMDAGPMTAAEAVSRGLVDEIGHKRAQHEAASGRSLATKEPAAVPELTPEQLLALEERITTMVERKKAERVLSGGPVEEAEHFIIMPDRAAPREEKKSEDKTMTLGRYRLIRTMEKEDEMARARAPGLFRSISRMLPLGWGLPADDGPGSTSGPAPGTGDPALQKTVGLVYLCGRILQGDAQFGGNAVAKALVEAGRDADVDALVFRIDSGGGDAVASETIHEAVQHVQRELGKPVVASFGNVAASGGYYAAASADRIVAMPGTITGSIGVAAMRPDVTSKALDALGITFDEVFTTESGRSQNLLRPLEGEHLARYRRSIDDVYAVFLQRVADGRRLAVDAVRAVAGGRVFSGRQALDCGLVDELGGIDRALAAAAQLAVDRDQARLPAQVRELQERLRTKLGLVAPTPQVEIKVFPRRKSLWERMRDPVAQDVDLGASVEARLLEDRARPRSALGAAWASATLPLRYGAACASAWVEYAFSQAVRSATLTGFEVAVQGLGAARVETLLSEWVSRQASPSISLDSGVSGEGFA